MVFPAGVVTRMVTLPQITDTFGQPVSGIMTITPSLPLKWEATDQLVLSDPVSTDIVAGTASVALPIVQSGFILANALLRVDAWTYKVVLSLPAGVQDVPDLVFLLPSGPGDYMLDFATPAIIPETVVTVTEFVGVGEPGPANTLSIGTVVTGIPSSATITGTSPNQILNLVLERGPAGEPGASVGFPIGGTTGQIAVKQSGTDYDVAWANQPVGIPAAGTTGQALIKDTNADYDVSWGTVSGGAGVPPGGSTGEVLTKLSGTDGDADWEPSSADQVNVLYSGGAYPTQAGSPPAGLKVRHFYGPVQYSGATWSGVLDVYVYAALV